MIDWANEKVVVTGGAGFIGSHLVDVLLARGVKKLMVIDNLCRGTMANVPDDVSLRPIDLKDGDLDYNDFDLIAFLSRRFEDAVIFHFAARVTNIRENRGDHLGMLQDNLRINANVFEAARLGKPKLFEATSTVCVYPHNAPVPTPESAAFPFHPEDTNEGYGIAKAILEKQAQYLHKECGIPVLVPRFANAFGPRDYYDYGSSHVAPALIRKAFEDDEIVVWGSGKQTRTLVDARDIAETVVRLAEAPEAHNAQPINIGYAVPVSISDLLFTILDLTDNSDKRVTFDASQPDGHAVRQFDCTRLMGLIGIPPTRRLEDTLTDMIAEFRAGKARL